MGRVAPVVTLTEEERKRLASWTRAGKTEQRLALRSHIILSAARGQQNKEIAQALGIREATVSKWRSRFWQHRLAGLQDDVRSGKPPKYDASTEERILEALDEAPPKGYATWTGPLLAQKLGISEHHVWRVLRKHRIALARRRSWCISTDPEFAAKTAAIIGLYLDPPEKAVVICVDEKPAIQALERLQGWLRLPNGKALTGFNHEYKRNGTTTLFAAFEVATGLVKTGHFKRRRRREFLTFMNELVDEFQGQEMYVILDNLNTHKPKCDRWLKKHTNVRFFYTPTHASWMNQVEIWFSILWKKALRGTSFVSIQQLRKAIDDFVEAYNRTAHPFEWKATEVKPVAPKLKYADLRS